MEGRLLARVEESERENAVEFVRGRFRRSGRRRMHANEAPNVLKRTHDDNDDDDDEQEMKQTQGGCNEQTDKENTQ